jgi:Ca2+-binding RTX toxin-like protein
VWSSDGSALLVDTSSVEDVIGTGFDDQFRGNTADNVWTAGGGNDRFMVRPGMGSDTITDFVGGTGASDVLDVSAFHYASADEALAHATQAGADTIFDLSAGNVLTLLNTLKSSLVADDFIIA